MKLIDIGLKKCVEMKKLFLIIVLSLLSGYAKGEDTELNRLTDIVKSLQTGGEKAYKAAINQLAADRQWTPMDELGFDRAIECKASERVPGFKLNSVMNNAENKERYQTTTGNYINGADHRYSYSLFEKTQRAGKTATFKLPQRWGDQTIIIIPYQGVNARLSASALSGNVAFTVKSLGDGAIKLSGKAIKGQPLTLKVTNGSETNISYVILNHNTRK